MFCNEFELESVVIYETGMYEFYLVLFIANMTSVVAEGCEEFDLIPLSAEESSATYGFLQTCPVRLIF